MPLDLQQIEKLKQEGNEAFKSKNFEQAKEFYSKALELIPIHEKKKEESKQTLSILYCNRGATYLQLNNFEECLKDCNSALELSPNLVKALYRRCLAYEGLKEYKLAFDDIREVLRLDPKNKEAQQAAARLMITVEKENEASIEKPISPKGLLNKIQSDISLDEKLHSLSQLNSLAKEKGQDLIKEDAISRLGDIICDPNINIQIKSNSLKILSSLCHQKSFCLDIATKLSTQFFVDLCKGPNRAELAPSCCSILAHLLAAMESDQRVTFWDSIVEIFIDLIQQTGSLRDHALNNLIQLPWDSKSLKSFIDKHLGNLLIVLCRDSGKMLSVFLSKLLSVPSSKDSDLNAELKTKIDVAFKKLMASTKEEENIDCLRLLSSALLADSGIGVSIFLSEIQPIVEMMDVLILTEAKNDIQLLASEILALATSHKDFQKICEPGLLDEFLVMLKSDNPQIQARVLAATSKLATSNEKVKETILKDDGKEELQKIISLLNSNLTPEINQWVVEALTFLSYHPPAKELIVQNSKVVDLLFKLVTTSDRNLWFGIATTFTNLTHYIRQNDEIAELTKQIQKMASGEKQFQHLKIDPLDEDAFVDKRCSALVQFGAVKILCLMTKGEDEKGVLINVRELVSQVFVNLATFQKNRGKMVQDGAPQALLSLIQYKNSTPKTKNLAAHAIAKIAISIDPNLGFRETLASSFIEPLKALLRSDDPLQQFESMMALTNLALVGPEIATLIIKDKGLSDIEYLQLDQNFMLQRAASELLCNLLQLSDMADEYRNMNSLTERRLKIWAGLSGADDLKTALASSGALAILSSDPEICKVIYSIVGVDPFLQLIAENDGDLQHRGAEVLKNFIFADKKIAEAIVEKGGVISLMKLLAEPLNKNAQQIASEALNELKKMNLIKV